MIFHQIFLRVQIKNSVKFLILPVLLVALFSKLAFLVVFPELGIIISYECLKINMISIYIYICAFCMIFLNVNLNSS